MYDADLTTLIVNPAAAGGRVGRNWAQLEPQIRQHLGALAIVHTQRIGHAMTLAEDAVNAGQTTVLSLGGDGTHNEVVNGIMNAKPEPGAVTFGVLPAGTGGDFRRLLNGGNDVIASAAAIPSAESSALDVGSVSFETFAGERELRYFVNIASFGLAGLVDQYLNASGLKRLGRVSFMIATLRGLLKYKNASVLLKVDGTEHGPYRIVNVAIANGRFFGAGMMVAPNAQIADGQFDITVIEEAPLHRLVRSSLKLYDGSHIGLPNVKVLRGAHIEATPTDDRPAYMDIDGEAPGVIPAEFKVHAGALRLLNPRPEIV